MIDYDEYRTLERICAHHGADDPELVKHLAALLEWVHASEQAQHGGPQPCFLLTLESLISLHTPARPDPKAQAA